MFIWLLIKKVHKYLNALIYLILLALIAIFISKKRFDYMSDALMEYINFK